MVSFVMLESYDPWVFGGTMLIAADKSTVTDRDATTFGFHQLDPAGGVEARVDHADRW